MSTTPRRARRPSAWVASRRLMVQVAYDVLDGAGHDAVLAPYRESIGVENTIARAAPISGISRDKPSLHGEEMMRPPATRAVSRAKPRQRSASAKTCRAGCRIWRGAAANGCSTARLTLVRILTRGKCGGAQVRSRLCRAKAGRTARETLGAARLAFFPPSAD
jgi:hypothetical protein